MRFFLSLIIFELYFKFVAWIFHVLEKKNDQEMRQIVFEEHRWGMQLDRVWRDTALCIYMRFCHVVFLIFSLSNEINAEKKERKMAKNSLLQYNLFMNISSYSVLYIVHNIFFMETDGNEMVCSSLLRILFNVGLGHESCIFELQLHMFPSLHLLDVEWICKFTSYLYIFWHRIHTADVTVGIFGNNHLLSLILLPQFLFLLRNFQFTSETD